MNIKMIIEFLSNLDLGWYVAGGILGVAVLRQIIKSKKVEDKFGDICEGSGEWLSNIIMSKLGKALENPIELFILDVKALVDVGLGRFVIGLRKNNKNGELKEARETLDKVKKLNDSSRENIKKAKAMRKVSSKL